MMLFVDPSAVDMTRATREYATGAGSLTRQQGGPGVFSKSGILGDATVATRAYGQVLVDTLVAGALEDIEALRNAPLPTARAATPAPPPPSAPRPAVQTEQRSPMTGCTSGEERSIRQVGMTFTSLWRQMDAEKIAELFAATGDMRHPDGTIERGPEIIRTNR